MKVTMKHQVGDVLEEVTAESENWYLRDLPELLVQFHRALHYAPIDGPKPWHVPQVNRESNV